MTDGLIDLLYFLNEVMSIIVKVGIVTLLWVLVPKLRLKNMIMKEYIEFHRSMK